YTTTDTFEKLAGAEYGKDGENKVVTMNAVWKANEYDIIFNRNDGVGSTKAHIFVDGADKGESETVSMKGTYASVYPADMFNDSKLKITRDGYDFVGWTLEQNVPLAERDSKKLTSTDVFESTQTLTLYAQWKNKKVTAKLYALTKPSFANQPKWPNGNNIDDTNPITHDIYFDMPYGASSETGLETNALPIPTCTGFDFSKWFAPKTNSEPKPTNWQTETDVATNKFTAITDGITKLSNFEALTTDASGNLSMNLYGLWEVGVVRLYLVSTYSSAGKTYSSNKTVKYGVRVGYKSDNVTSEPLPTPTRQGYDFDKWMSYASIPSSNPISNTADTVVTNETPYWNTIQSATAYAAWRPKTYTVKFSIAKDTTPDNNANSISWQRTAGTSVDSGRAYNNQYQYDSVVAAAQIPVPTRPGYTFEYWAPENSSKRYSADGNWTMDIYNDTTVLYPYWSGETYTITYDLWGGSQGKSSTTPKIKTAITNTSGITYNAGTAYNVVTSSVAYKQLFKTGFTSGKLPEPIRDGYDFVGWYATQGPFFTDNNWDNRGDHGWKNPIDANTQFVQSNLSGENIANITLKALWIPKQVQIKFDYTSAGYRNIFVDGQALSTGTKTINAIFGTKFNSQYSAGQIVEGALPTTNIEGNIFSANVDDADKQHAYPESQAQSLRQKTY
ncbi:MAG: InlB B-repeat-containing protein, partial [Lachnospiraceae bacterium]|nr:InlB B-repeat-containing protein [Lachnospiraceae bacterium]